MYGASTVLTRAAALLIVPIYTRLLGPAEYGAIDILSIFGNLVTLTIALEISQAVARFIPDEADGRPRAIVVTTAVGFTIVVYTAFLALALAFVEPLRALLVNDLASTLAVALAVSSAWAIGIFQLLQTVLRFAMRPLAYMIASVVFSLGGLALSVTLVVAFDAGVAGIFAGQVIGGIAGSLVATAAIRQLFVAAFDIRVLRRMLAFSIPLVPASIGVFVTLYIDRIALSALVSLSAVGVFGIGYRLASAISLLLIGFQMALTPLIYQRYREPSTPGDLARIFRIFVGGALMAAAALSVFAPEILRVLTTAPYYAAQSIVPILAPAILLSNMYVFMPGLSIAKQTAVIALITIGGGALNTLLSLSLIPLMGIEGAAVATLITATVVFAAYSVTSQRAYPVPHRWTPIIVAAGGYVAVVMIGMWLEPMRLVSVAAKTALLAAYGVGIMFVGLVRPAEVAWVADRIRRAVRRPA